MNKYGAKKTSVNGILFDSKAESSRYSDLALLEKAGHISGLTCQVPFELAPSVKYLGDKRAKPPLRYVADFVYCENGVIVVEDCKGVITDGFRIKRHLMKWVKGIDVRISK
jgi:hypothetical protein